MKFSIIKFLSILVVLVCVLNSETHVRSTTNSGTENKSEMSAKVENKLLTENKLRVQAQVQVKNKSQSTSQAKTQVKTENKLKTENKSSMKTNSKSESTVQTEIKSTNHVQAKTEMKANSQSQSQTQTQTQSQTQTKSSTSSSTRVSANTKLNVNFKLEKHYKKNKSNNNKISSLSESASAAGSVMSYLGSLYNSDKKNKNYQTPIPSASSNQTQIADQPTQTPVQSSTPDKPQPTGSPAPLADQPIPDILQDWLMISSPVFQNKSKFPPVTLPNGKVVIIKYDNENFRINEAHQKNPDTTAQVAPSEKFFWFRHVGSNIYYSSTDTDLNILGVVSIKSINSIKIKDKGLLAETSKCFAIEDFENCQWDLCANDTDTMKKWLCKLQSVLEQHLDPICNNPDKDNNVTVVEKRITQPIIIIPTPSPFCNENWNYQRRGEDWNCECSEGTEQSPVNLPNKFTAIDTVVKPLFQYDDVSFMSQETTLDGAMRSQEKLKLRLDQNVLKIIHKQFGKLVTMDGAVYHAQEILIHTPAEHRIGGRFYDMEIQIIHYGQSQGDIAKQAVLSFLFEKKPGAYNKFIDDLDFFNLPNPLNKEVELNNNINISKIFYSADDTEIPIWKPFSFYTYQGSLTSPPCSERTIMYVASRPLPISTTALQLFQEALRVPDLMNEKGDVLVSDWTPLNSRMTQPLRGRPVFHYDHEKNCGPDPVKPEIKPAGHYEKIDKAVTNYFYVNDSEPSGLPGAFVVSEKEALGVIRK